MYSLTLCKIYIPVTYIHLVFASLSSTSANTVYVLGSFHPLSFHFKVSVIEQMHPCPSKHRLSPVHETRRCRSKYVNNIRCYRIMWCTQLSFHFKLALQANIYLPNICATYLPKVIYYQCMEHEVLGSCSQYIYPFISSSFLSQWGHKPPTFLTSLITSKRSMVCCDHVIHVFIPSPQARSSANEFIRDPPSWRHLSPVHEAWCNRIM